MRTLKVIVLVIVALVIAGYGYYRYRYPYGWTHCCDSCLYLDLLQYAEQHDGWFPCNEDSPEASLSLVSRQRPGTASVLCGKSVPESVVKDILGRGELLTPQTCGWNYVEGLRNDDDSRLALFWDKEGLDHFGGRLRGGGHVVVRIHGSFDHVPESEWAAFIEEQEKLRPKRAPPSDVYADAWPEFVGKPGPGATQVEEGFAIRQVVVARILVFEVAGQCPGRTSCTERWTHGDS
jgi:hypothetical protein